MSWLDFTYKCFYLFSEKEIIREKMNQGNKRTPQRFVGREAIVTTQCLNGWLVTIYFFPQAVNIKSLFAMLI